MSECESFTNRPMTRLAKKQAMMAKDTIREISQDDFSLLPDEILIYLNLREASRVSILSKRWKELSMFCKKLTFDYQFRDGNKIGKCVKRVNRILKSNLSVELDEFVAHLCLDNTYQGDVDNWVKYAISKGVRKLVLAQCGSFPNPLHRRFCTDKSYRNGLKFLRDLHLYSVWVSEVILQYLVEHCPSLERLTVEKVPTLKRIRITGGSMNLKHLCIRHCGCERSIIKLSNINLVTLVVICSGKVELCNVPTLTRISVWRHNYQFSHGVLSQLSCSLSNLEFLSVTISDKDLAKMTSQEFHLLDKLTRLEIRASVANQRSLKGIAALLRACPFLQKFVLVVRSFYGQSCKPKRYPEATNCPLQQLQEVELRGYSGEYTDFELLRYISENATALKTIFIEAEGRIKPLLRKNIPPNLSDYVQPYKPKSYPKATNCPLQHLQEVELRGFSGQKGATELLMYISKNATALQAIVIEQADNPGKGLHRLCKIVGDEFDLTEYK